MKAAGGIDDEGVAAHDAGFAEGFLGETDDQVRACLLYTSPKMVSMTEPSTS